MPPAGPGCRGTRLSPLDGRYAEITQPITGIFCESSLVLHRYRVEFSWLQALVNLPATELRLDTRQAAALAELAEPEPDALMAEVFQLELSTRHDVKAVEMCLAARLCKAGLDCMVPWVHFGCTSWDINNIAYALMLQAAQCDVLVPSLANLQARLVDLAQTHATVPMLGRTHGQPASPTTLGKELRVFANRLERQLSLLQAHVFDGKFNGAVGNYNAMVTALPTVDWPAVTQAHVTGFGLRFATVTTQVEPYDGMVEFFDVVTRLNRILQDLAQDLSLYAGMGHLQLATTKGEVGSSTMPHKVNPIAFENAEGNLAIANALLGAFGQELQVSRLQRDLSDSTVLRNIGVALGHSLIAWQALHQGLAGITSNTAALAAELDANWQVLAEAVQTVLRRSGDPQAYDKLKVATRGNGKMDKQDYQALVKKLLPPGKERERLLALAPATYLGLAPSLASVASDGTTNQA